MNPYAHEVRIDEASRELKIFRVEANGERSLYTSVKLPNSKGWTPELKSFAQQLGENLLVDSPSARDLLGL